MSALTYNLKTCFSLSGSFVVAVTKQQLPIFYILKMYYLKDVVGLPDIFLIHKCATNVYLKHLLELNIVIEQNYK